MRTLEMFYFKKLQKISSIIPTDVSAYCFLTASELASGPASGQKAVSTNISWNDARIFNIFTVLSGYDKKDIQKAAKEYLMWTLPAKITKRLCVKHPNIIKFTF